MPLPHSPSPSTLTLLSSSDSARNSHIYEIMDDKAQTTKECLPLKVPRSGKRSSNEMARDPVQDLRAAHILRRSIFHKYDGGEFTLPATLDIIKCYANIPWNSMKTVAEYIDTPVNRIAMQYTLHTLFDNFAWCLHATDVPETYDVHWFGPIPRGFENFQQVCFQDHSKHGIPLPHPKFIAIYAAVAHVLHLSGAGKVMYKIYDRFFGEGQSSMPSGHISRNEDLALSLVLMELMRSNHQLPTVPHGRVRSWTAVRS